MKPTKIPLLKGSYPPVLAHELLTRTIRNEMAFHRLQNFESLLRFEGNCTQATVNLRAFSRASDNIESLLQEARREGYKVSIESLLQISLIREPAPEVA